MWSEDCQESFNMLKSALTQAPVLAYPSQNDHFVLDTDASNYGMGAVLSQKQDNSEKVVCYFSKSFCGPERKYCVTRRELLAIVMSIKHFSSLSLRQKVHCPYRSWSITLDIKL